MKSARFFCLALMIKYASKTMDKMDQLLVIKALLDAKLFHKLFHKVTKKCSRKLFE